VEADAPLAHDATSAPTPAAALEPADDTFDVPPVEPEPADVPIVAEAIPPIDEAAQVVDRPLGDAAPQPVVEPSTSADPLVESIAAAVATGVEPGGQPELILQVEAADSLSGSSETEPSLDVTVDPTASVENAETDAPEAAQSELRPALAPAEPPAEDAEAAAMRAIEGGWSPRRAPRAPRPVQHPEYVGPHEVDTAVQTARSAVASAAAAAAAAIAENREIERERRAATAALDFELPREATPHSFLDDDAEPARHAIETSGLSFEPKRHGGFGRPEGLSAPRQGQSDNLKQIKGITPQLESSLNELGVFHFDQVAGWDQKAIVWLDNHLALKGRIGKEKWLEQARDLAHGRGRVARPVRR
jgi:predicted flap endonuclease-1-like 5' DNA nuclease